LGPVPRASCDPTLYEFAEFAIASKEAGLVAAPLLPQCFANLECRVVETRLVDKYNLFILEVVKARIEPKQKNAKTIHLRGYGPFVVDGELIKLKSRRPEAQSRCPVLTLPLVAAGP
jgi:flavin reductase (DIM6/NTAB) family NADH-FMN oxidoreductase RutF